MRRASRVCAELSPRLRGTKRGLGVVERLLGAGLRLDQGGGTVVGKLRVFDRGLLHRDIGELQIGIEREQRRAQFDDIALSHRKGLDPPGLVGPDKDHVGLDPTLEGRLLVATAASKD